MRSCLATAAVGIATAMALFAAAAAPDQPAQPHTGPQQPLLLYARSRVPGTAGSYTIQEKELKWDPKQTVLTICDMRMRSATLAPRSGICSRAERSRT
jgi:hypothetical protein